MPPKETDTPIHQVSTKPIRNTAETPTMPQTDTSKPILYLHSRRLLHSPNPPPRSTRHPAHRASPTDPAIKPPPQKPRQNPDRATAPANPPIQSALNVQEGEFPGGRTAAMPPVAPSFLLLLLLLLAGPALLTPSASRELEVRGHRTPRDAKQDSIKVVISEGCATQGDSSDSQGGKEIDLAPGTPLVLTHRIKLVPSGSGSGSGSGSCGCEADFAALRERLERLEREVSTLREKCGGPEGGCCTSKESKGAGCSIKPEVDECPNECSDQGRCVDGKCVCFPGFSGPDCSQSNCPGNCNDNGRCVNGQCVCDPGFTGPDCSQRGCPDNCNNRGRCVNGQCVCNPGFTGPDCSQNSCPDNCNNRGRCVNGQCVCNPGFTGPDCSQNSCPDNCNNKGRCVNGRCVCDSGFTGPSCSDKSCPGNCKNKGRCVNGQCVCDSGFTGPDCSKRACPDNCNNRGRCVNGKCVCDSGFTGADCSEISCPGNCNTRGRCVNGQCVCDHGFTGPDCSEKACPDNCNDHGRCVDGQCVCKPGFTGPDCSTKACPNNCSNRGKCVNGKCVCDVGAAGPDCSAKGCPSNCNNKGRCVKGKCVCRRGFTGPDCSQCEAGMTGPNCDTVMSGVSQLSTKDVTETSVTLIWTPPPIQYQTYHITFTSQKESDQKITVQVEGSLTTFTQTGLAAGQEYTVTVTGETDGRMGAESSAEFMTLISGPSNLQVVKTTTTSAVVQWEQSQGEIDRYRLTISPNDGAGRSQEMILPPGRDSAHIEQLEAGRLYDILLVAEKGASQSEPATTQATPGKILPRVTMAAVTMQVTPAPGQDPNGRDPTSNLTPVVKVFDRQGRREDGSDVGSVEVGGIVGSKEDSSASVIARTKPLVSRKDGTKPKPGERPILPRKPITLGSFRLNATRVVPGGRRVGPGPLKKPPGKNPLVGAKAKAPKPVVKKPKPGSPIVGDRTVALTVRDPSAETSSPEREADFKWFEAIVIVLIVILLINITIIIITVISSTIIIIIFSVIIIIRNISSSSTIIININIIIAIIITIIITITIIIDTIVTTIIITTIIITIIIFLQLRRIRFNTGEPLDYVGVRNLTSDGFTLVWDAPEGRYKNFVVTRKEQGGKDEERRQKKEGQGKEEAEEDPEEKEGSEEEEGKPQITKAKEAENGRAREENFVPESVVTHTIHSGTTAKPATGRDKTITKVLPGSARSFPFENLPPQTDYTVTLLGKAPGLLSRLHKLVISTGPEPPTNLVFSELTENSLTVSWTKPKNPTSSFKVTYTHTEDGEPVSVSVGSDDSTLGLSQLSPGSTYEVSVISVLGLDESDPVKDYVTTLPDPPTDLKAINVTDTTALLLWRPALAAVDKYAIVYGAGTGSELRITVSGNAAEQQLSGLEGSTTYTVTIRSLLGSRESPAATTSFTTGSGLGRLAEGPRDLQASRVTPRTALLSWKPPSTAVGSYRLTYQTEGQEMKEVTVGGGVTEHKLSRLHPGSTYSVQLQAERGGRLISPVATEFTTGTLRFPFPSDCSQELLNGVGESGEAEIFPQGKHGSPLMVYCDMETDGGGWTVFQRRENGTVDFFRGWKDYSRGFGNLSGEFWLGLENLHNLTTMTRMILRVDLRAGDESVFAKYSTFQVGKRNYRLSVAGYSGTAGDSMSYHNNRLFSTKDRDLEPFITRCAMSYRGGWWYKNCHEANLNGLYGIDVKHQGVIWTSWKGTEFSIPFTEMKMRPAAFTPPTRG
ncbi:tenascin-like [Centroberyx affinis]|uniref:tenascin-like n=1 Tax=Centroberyx affinis TaxID=166261 RepID=UPI003A5BC1CF